MDHDQFLRGLLTSRVVISAVLVVICTSLVVKFIHRRLFYRNLPGPPHSFLFGHLPALISASLHYPPDVHPQLIINHVIKTHKLHDQPVVYLDSFPIRNDSQAIIIDPKIAAQIQQHTRPFGMRKHPMLTKQFGRVLGLRSLTLSVGETWHPLHSIFAPGFSARNISAMVPAILEEAEVFLKKLHLTAATGTMGDDGRQGFVRSLDVLLKRLTVDIIFRALLDLRVHEQERPTEVMHLIAEHSKLPAASNASLNPLQALDLKRVIMERWYERKISGMLKKEISKRWEIIRPELEEKGKLAGDHKVIVDLPLIHRWEERKDAPGDTDILDDDFLGLMADNVKAFIFGGYDTTANAIAWIIYELSRHPDILDEVRREHAAVFGPEPLLVGEKLRDDPSLLNCLPFTVAVIKETMRLYPPASSIREADPGTVLTSSDGRTFPATSQLLFITGYVSGRAPQHFPSPGDFRPHRFLAPGSHPHAQPVDADLYRPFERGPRACIGQELAMVEMKLMMTMMVRKFEFRAAYDELARREGRRKIEKVEGEGDEAYQVLFSTAQPKDGMPVWVRELDDEDRY